MAVAITQILVGLVILIQLLISLIEMFFWLRRYQALEPIVVLTEGEAKKVKPIIQNVGLYNAFIAAGLIWGLFSTANTLEIETFFLSCVLIAGVFGAITLKRTTLVIQTLPSLVALIAVWYSYKFV